MSDYADRRTMMVDTQIRPSDVTKFTIIEAMLSVPREVFVPSAKREAAYADAAMPLGSGRFMVEPRTLAKMLDALDVTNTDLVLDLGAGYGYSSAVLARMAEAVVAVEPNEEFATEAQDALNEVSADNVIWHTGALVEGAEKLGPYDVILVQGGVEMVPDALVSQLKDGGRIGCLFMDGPLGSVKIGYKSAGSISWRFAFNATAPMLDGFANESSFAL